MTGLTRLEVKRIVSENCAIRPPNIETAPRTLRVIEAWRTSKRYSKSGQPIPLKMVGATPSFESLCKQFSGDIPHTAILTELLAKGLVRIAKRGRLPIVVATQKSGSAWLAYAEKLEFIASITRAIADESRVLVRAKQFVPASREIAPAYSEKSVASRVSTMIGGLPVGKRRGKAQVVNRKGLDVFAVVSRRS